jgi:hypothetical protein
MGSTLGKITDWTGITNVSGLEQAGREGREAAELQADYQRRAMEDLQAQNVLPRQLRTGAMEQLGGLYGIGGNQQDALAQLKQSPIYAGIMGTRAGGEEAILRNQAATGGLRSGNTQQALAQYNQDLENQALMQTMGGLQGLAQTQTYDPLIAQHMGGIGQTQAQGLMAESQGRVAGAEQRRDFARQERQYGHEFGMSMAGGMGSGGGSSFSDEALKDGIIKIGEENGVNIYKWVWNELAEKLGLRGYGCGVIAQEIEKTNPDAVSMSKGFKTVNYDMIGVNYGGK